MKRLELLDYGRFFAAIFVVLFHYTLNGISNGKISSISYNQDVIAITKYGYLGVQLFFMISGYVIFYSAKNRLASQFAVSRFTRLYPSFWFAILFTAFFALFWGGGNMSVTLTQVFANFTMVPELFGYKYVDGVYWTLILELKFYLLVFVLILVGLQKRLEIIFLAWPFLLAAALVTGNSKLPYMDYHYCFFSAGVILAMLRDRFSLITCTSLLLSFALCLYLSVMQAPGISAEKGVEYSGLIIGAIICLFFLFFLALNSGRGSSLKLPLSYTLGALTYPIYLIHAHFGYMFISQFATEQNKFIIYLVTFSIVASTAYLMHSIIEIKYAKVWKHLFQVTIGNTGNILQKCSLSLYDFLSDNKIGMKK